MNWRRGVYRIALIVTTACACILLVSLLGALLPLAGPQVFQGILVALVLVSAAIIIGFLIPLALYIRDGFRGTTD